MELGFRGIDLVGLNCPYFTGIQEHGQKACFDLDLDTADYFKVYSDRTTLHIHQDGTMYITRMDYNSFREEHEEKIIIDLTNDAAFKNDMNNWLKENPLYRDFSFPYEVSTREDAFGGNRMICDSLDSLINYLKNY